MQHEQKFSAFESWGRNEGISCCRPTHATVQHRIFAKRARIYRHVNNYLLTGGEFEILTELKGYLHSNSRFRTDVMTAIRRHPLSAFKVRDILISFWRRTCYAAQL